MIKDEFKTKNERARNAECCNNHGSCLHVFHYHHCICRPAQEIDQEKAAAKWITPAAEKAIASGLRWLAERQHEDGSFGNGPAG